MGHFNIQKPIWGTQSIGIAKRNLKDKFMDVEILYEDVHGNRVYPHVYRMETAKIKKYPVRSFGNTPPLFIVPIADFEVILEEELTEDQIAYKRYCESNGITFNKDNA